MTKLPDSNYVAPTGPQKFMGKPIKRVEDPRFITGAGLYTDDINVHGQLHAAMLRSPYAHAKIGKIDASEALALPGVRAVLTGKSQRRHVQLCHFVYPNRSPSSKSMPLLRRRVIERDKPRR